MQAYSSPRPYGYYSASVLPTYYNPGPYLYSPRPSQR